MLNKILDAARTGKWVLVCPIVFPQYLPRVVEKLHEVGMKVHTDFRLIIDTQNMKANQIPDSFLSKNAYRFVMNEQNADPIVGFSDIW